MPQTKTFNVHYYRTDPKGLKEILHTYEETWAKNDYYCPNCGKKSVWAEEGGGDYYVGERHICLACNHDFYLPHGTDDTSDSEQGAQRLAALKKS